MTAAIVAPILALLSYFAIDALVGEKPHAAEAGQSYELVEKPNCRRGGGQCSLKNGEFELDISAQMVGGNSIVLSVESAFPLDGVKIALVENSASKHPPIAMLAIDEDQLTWNLEVSRPTNENHRLRLVASAGQALYFGDATTRFLFPAE